jgi:hypothetical protein
VGLGRRKNVVLSESSREPYPWREFVSPSIDVDLARRLLPAWVGITGAAPVDARTSVFVLEELGLTQVIEDLSTEWTRALATNSPRLARAALRLWPAHGSWWALLLQLAEWQRRIVEERSSNPAWDQGRQQ